MSQSLQSQFPYKASKLIKNVDYLSLYETIMHLVYNEFCLQVNPYIHSETIDKILEDTHSKLNAKIKLIISRWKTSTILMQGTSISNTFDSYWSVLSIVKNNKDKSIRQKGYDIKQKTLNFLTKDTWNGYLSKVATSPYSEATQFASEVLVDTFVEDFQLFKNIKSVEDLKRYVMDLTGFCCLLEEKREKGTLNEIIKYDEDEE